MQQWLYQRVTDLPKDAKTLLPLALPRSRYHHRSRPARGLYEMHIALLELRTGYRDQLYD
jgi:hypothetical protein